MKKIITARVAGIIILLLLLGLFILHIFILLGVLSFDLVWGGNIESRESMIKLETFAILTTFLFLIITFYKLRTLKRSEGYKIINIGVWIMFAYFTLNIIGNIVAKTGAERAIFIPVSLLLSLFSLRLALVK